MPTNNDKINKLIYNDSILSGKVHESLEDPISQFFYDVSDNISPFLCRAGITPNQITTLRFMLSTSVFLYCFDKKMYKTASVLYMISYFGDCLDGHMARKYNMETIFGDYYDHVVDISVGIISLYCIGTTLNKKYKWVMFIILLLLVMSIFQMSCEERYLEIIGAKIHSTSLQPIRCLCSPAIVANDELDETMELSRLFGVGTYQLFVMIIIWNMRYLK